MREVGGRETKKSVISNSRIPSSPHPANDGIYTSKLDCLFLLILLAVYSWDICPKVRGWKVS